MVSHWHPCLLSVDLQSYPLSQSAQGQSATNSRPRTLAVAVVDAPFLGNGSWHVGHHARRGRQSPRSPARTVPASLLWDYYLPVSPDLASADAGSELL